MQDLVTQGFTPPLHLSDFRLAAFDMDSTLINIECIDEIAAAAGKKEEVAAITEAAMRGEISDFKDSLRRRLALLQGVPVSALEQVQGRARVLTLTVEAVAPITVRLSVQDNGPGVPAALADRLFEPFVSGRPGGLGLGLSLCETLAAEMGGHIRHTPAQPGAVFVLDLPAGDHA